MSAKRTCAVCGTCVNSLSGRAVRNERARHVPWPNSGALTDLIHEPVPRLMSRPVIARSTGSWPTTLTVS